MRQVPPNTVSYAAWCGQPAAGGKREHRPSS